MKKVLIYMSLAALALGSLTSCYEDFIKDYSAPNMGFALPAQLRTVIESKNSIYVGVSIGGKREVDLNDWATFEIDGSLLDGTGKILMPSSYYTLSDPNTFRVRRTGMAVADVEVKFSDEFYADPKALNGDYALPFRITGVSIPAVADSTGYVNPAGAIRPGAETAIVAVKYINEYSGVYYKFGSVTELDSSGNPVGGPVVYGDSVDLINCQTVTLNTSGRYQLTRSGLANSSSGSMIMDIASPDSDTSPLTLTGGSGIKFSNVKATLRRSGKYTFYGGTDPCPQIDLEYTYTSLGKTLRVNEVLVLRQWAESALRIETF